MNRPPLIMGGQCRHAREAIASAHVLAWCIIGAAILGVYIASKVFA